MNHYRGKHKSTNKWIYGDYDVNVYNGFYNIEFGIKPKNDRFHYEVAAESVGQYTGLEIYDIVEKKNIKIYDKMKFKYEGHTLQVVWKNDRLYWGVVGIDINLSIYLSDLDFKLIEIIQD